MKKNKFNFLITGLVVVLIAGFFSVGIANAANSSIYISPSILDKQVGDAFVLVATVNTDGSKVCGVEGKLQLDSELSCQSIIVGEGMMAQKAPSCADPSFLIGIPNCTTVNKTLFTIAIKAQNAGSATVSFTDIDVIGEGFSLSNTSVSGNYNITAVSKVPAINPQTTKPTPIVPLVVPVENCVCENWSDWERVDCGVGECEDNQLAQSRSRSCDPTTCEIDVENRCVADAYCASAIASNQTATIFGAGTIKYLWLLGGAIFLAIIIYVFRFLLINKRKDSDSKVDNLPDRRNQNTADRRQRDVGHMPDRRHILDRRIAA